MRMALVALAALAAASGAAASSVSDKAAGFIPDPFPSLRKKGDSVFTTVAAKLADFNETALGGNKTVPVKGACALVGVRVGCVSVSARPPGGCWKDTVLPNFF